MIRHIRLRYDWLSHLHVLTEEIVKRRVREPVSAGMRDPLLERNSFKRASVCRARKSVQCFLSGEHLLVVICIKIAANNQTFD